jgi:hypothetical protein
MKWWDFLYNIEPHLCLEIASFLETVLGNGNFGKKAMLFYGDPVVGFTNKNILYFVYVEKNQQILVDFPKIWEVLSNKYKLKNIDIKVLISKYLSHIYELEINTVGTIVMEDKNLVNENNNDEYDKLPKFCKLLLKYTDHTKDILDITVFLEETYGTKEKKLSFRQNDLDYRDVANVFHKNNQPIFVIVGDDYKKYLTEYDTWKKIEKMGYKWNNIADILLEYLNYVYDENIKLIDYRLELFL